MTEELIERETTTKEPIEEKTITEPVVHEIVNDCCDSFEMNTQQVRIRDHETKFEPVKDEVKYIDTDTNKNKPFMTQSFSRKDPVEIVQSNAHENDFDESICDETTYDSDEDTCSTVNDDEIQELTSSVKNVPMRYQEPSYIVAKQDEMIHSDENEMTMTHTVTQETPVQSIIEDVQKVRDLDNDWINDEMNRSIKEVNMKTKKLKNKNKIRDILGYDIDTKTLKNNYKQIRNTMLLNDSKRWG